MFFSPPLLIVAVVVVFSSVARADLIFVDDDHCPGPGSGTEAEPFCSIQDAINAAVDTDEIVVAPGTYFENINFLGKSITLRSSDGPEVTTVDGTGNVHVVQCVSGEGPDTVLDGFTITGGDAHGPCCLSERVGGGMYNCFSSPTVTNCTFTGNSAVSGGGMFNADAGPTVTDCIFAGNSAAFGGGGMNSSGAGPTVTDCTFTDNSAGFGGGGMYNAGAGPTVANSTFSGNVARVAGGGIYNTLNSSPAMINCTFSGNSAEHGGGMYDDSSSPAMINCTFSGNSAVNGHALAFDSFRQCCPSDLTMTNCILRDGGDEISNSDGSTVTITYTNVQGKWPGTGNIDADPLFVDSGNGDFRRQTSSPAIDAGHNWAIAGLTDTDLDGSPRFAADRIDFDPGCGIPVVVDMGAYEFQGDPFPVKFGDIDGDGIVGIVDFLGLLAVWGRCPTDCCLADLDIDGNIGIVDFLLLLGNWTA